MIDAIVTGSKGFIGARLVAALEKRGKEVLGLSNCDGDVALGSTWAKLPSAKVVFHLAGRTFVPESWDNSPSFLQTNVIGTEQALSYCRRTGAGMVLASAYLYGIPQKLPISEKDIAAPNNPYALSKWMAEELASFASRYHDVPVTVLRIFNVFGYGQRETFLIPTIIKQVKEGDAVRVLDLAPKRDFVHVDDVVNAFLLASDSLSGFNLLNIGSGVSFSVSEIIDTIQGVSGTALPVLSVGTPRANEIPDVRASIDAAKHVLNWYPRCSFEDGIRETIFAGNERP
jgi:nucleoside-diphosphate-sugar epimerase